MKLVIGFVTLSILALGVFFYLNRYSSAFEADQACHFAKYSFNSVSSTIECDHDLETRQWILYKDGIDNQVAEVLQRFRY